MRLLSVLLLAMPLAAAAAPPTLCRAGETIYFNCAMGKAHKIASLCGRDAKDAPHYLQYRFGRVGETPELLVPAKLDDPAMGTTFFYEATRRADGRREEWGVWFHHLDAVYELDYDVDQDDAPQGEASILYWTGPAKGAPHGLACASADGGRALESADDPIGTMSPPQRLWQLSPYDERIRDEQRALRAAGAASR